METVRCAVTGPLGNVGYNLVFFLAGGGVFGPHQKISLNLVEIPELAQQLEGLRMELEDCAFPTLQEIRIGSDPFELFGDIDYAFLVGAKPRGPGMERKDLLLANGAIFQKQGQALDRNAKKSVQVLVVGNPCNTNCLIAFHNAPSLSPRQFAALTRLDEFRARAMLAKVADVGISEVSSVTIWGNHSATLVPDLSHTTIGTVAASSIVNESWRESTFIPGVRQRGAEIIKARGKSSAASAALAAVSAMGALVGQLPENSLVSMPVYSKGNPYGIDQNLFFSFPCRTGHLGVTMDLSMPPPEYLWKEVHLSEQELIEEREAVRHLFLTQ
jgi:malate dehydrogenase